MSYLVELVIKISIDWHSSPETLISDRFSHSISILISCNRTYFFYPKIFRIYFMLKKWFSYVFFKIYKLLVEVEISLYNKKQIYKY